MKEFLKLLSCDLKLVVRQKTEWASLLLFFIIIVILMPFALGPDMDILRREGPGLIWIAVLLMSLLSFDHLFVQDARDGVLDEMLTSPLPFSLIIWSKLVAHFVVMLGVLFIIAAPASLLFDMDFRILPILLMTFALGVPTLILFGGIAGAVTIALHRNAALLTLLLVPFYIPVLIFAVSACELASQGQDPEPPLLFLGALLTLILPTAPFIIASTLRHGQG